MGKKKKKKGYKLAKDTGQPFMDWINESLDKNPKLKKKVEKGLKKMRKEDKKIHKYVEECRMGDGF